jgi:hypothetical protein
MPITIQLKAVEVHVLHLYINDLLVRIHKKGCGSPEIKFEYTGPNQILEFIVI